jgi:hypothetical protein
MYYRQVYSLFRSVYHSPVKPPLLTAHLKRNSYNSLNANAHDKSHEKENSRSFDQGIFFDMVAMNAAIKDLNQLAGEGKMKIVAENGVHKFKPSDSISVTFFYNGIWLNNGPLRPYSLKECQSFCQDILDGYFPAEFKDQYPDGVIFHATDKSQYFYSPMSIKGQSPRNFQPFLGNGNSLISNPDNMSDNSATSAMIAQSTNKTPRMNGQCGGIPTPLQGANASASSVPHGSSFLPPGIMVTHEAPVPTSTVQQYLNVLPKQTIVGGKVVEIRSGIANMLGESKSKFSHSPDIQDGKVINISNQSTGNGNALIMVNTPTLELLQKYQSGAESKSRPGSARPKTPRDIATLRVKLDNCSNVYLIKMRFNDTIGMLRAVINEERIKMNKTGNYELKTTFPARTHTDDSKSLKDSGLTPNANIIVQAVLI